MKYLSRPAVQLFLLALLVIALGSVPDKNESVDIHFHDTFYVISIFMLAAAYTIILLTEAGLYAVTSWLRQWRWLQIFHVVCMIIPPLLLLVKPEMPVEGMAGMPRRYFEGGAYSLSFGQPLVVIAVVIFLLGQIGFVVNIIVGFIRGTSKILQK